MHIYISWSLVRRLLIDCLPCFVSRLIAKYPPNMYVFLLVILAVSFVCYQHIYLILWKPEWHFFSPDWFPSFGLFILQMCIKDMKKKIYWAVKVWSIIKKTFEMKNLKMQYFQCKIQQYLVTLVESPWCFSRMIWNKRF